MKNKLALCAALLVAALGGAACGAASDNGSAQAQDVGRSVADMDSLDEQVKSVTVTLCVEVGREFVDDADKLPHSGRDTLSTYGYLAALYWDICMQQDTSKPGAPADNDPPGDG